MVQKDQQEIQDRKAHKVLLEERMVHLDHKEMLERLDHKELQDRKDDKVYKDHQEILGQKVLTEVQKALLVHKALLALQVILLALKEIKDSQDRKALKAHKVHLVHLVHLVLLVHLVHLVLQEITQRLSSKYFLSLHRILQSMTSI